jgi:hypothetical protein
VCVSNGDGFQVLLLVASALKMLLQLRPGLHFCVCMLRDTCHMLDIFCAWLAVASVSKLHDTWIQE